MCDLVEAFIRRYPRNRYIVTSRTTGYRQVILSERTFQSYLVQPLKPRRYESA